MCADGPRVVGERLRVAEIEKVPSRYHVRGSSRRQFRTLKYGMTHRNEVASGVSDLGARFACRDRLEFVALPTCAFDAFNIDSRRSAIHQFRTFATGKVGFETGQAETDDDANVRR